MTKLPFTAYKFLLNNLFSPCMIELFENLTLLYYNYFLLKSNKSNSVKTNFFRRFKIREE